MIGLLHKVAHGHSARLVTLPALLLQNTNVLQHTVFGDSAEQAASVFDDLTVSPTMDARCVASTIDSSATSTARGTKPKRPSGISLILGKPNTTGPKTPPTVPVLHDTFILY